MIKTLTFSARNGRLPLEGDCLPDGSFVVPYDDGSVTSSFGVPAAPQAVRFCALSPLLDVAGQGQDEGTWRYSEATKAWTRIGAGVPGNRPYIFGADGTLFQAPQGPNLPSDGYTHIGSNGQPVYTVPHDDAHDIHEATPAGDWLIGQGSLGGIKALHLPTGNAYLLDAGDVRNIWVHYRAADEQLAICTRKLTEQQTVCYWPTSTQILAECGPYPGVVTPPVVVDPPKPPVTPPVTGGKMTPDQFSWSNCDIHYGTPDVGAFAETGHVEDITVNDGEVRTWFSTLAKWPKTYPNAAPGEIKSGQPANWTTFVVRAIGSRWHAWAAAVDYHDQPGEYSSLTNPREWSSNIFYTSGPNESMRTDEWWGIFFVAGARRGPFAGANTPGNLRERTTIGWAQNRSGEWRFDVPGKDEPGGTVPPPVVVVPPVVIPPTTDLTGRIGAVETSLGHVLRYIDEDSRPALSALDGRIDALEARPTGGIDQAAIGAIVDARLTNVARKGDGVSVALKVFGQSIKAKGTIDGGAPAAASARRASVPVAKKPVAKAKPARQAKRKAA